MKSPAPERSQYKLGKYDIVAQPMPGARPIFALTHRPGRPKKGAPPRAAASGEEL